MKYLTVAAVLLLTLRAEAQERQPFNFHVRNLVETLDYLGAPIADSDKLEIQHLVKTNSEPVSIQAILDNYSLFVVQVNPESRVKVQAGKAKAELWQAGWKTYLIKVENQAGITAELEALSDQAKRPYDGGERLYGMGHGQHVPGITQENISDRWLDISLYTQDPMHKALSGLEVEYFIIQLYSRDAGKRAAKFQFSCGMATQDLGFRNETSMLFNCEAAHNVKLDIKDEYDNPTTASFIVTDKWGRIYPSQAKRLAPDFFFQPQVYRSDGEDLVLPAGEYTIRVGRGPEYLGETRKLNVTDAHDPRLSVKLKRWIDPSKFGWYSGDHHIHAAGCSHYTSPTEGVDPADMMRHVVGEGVNVGSVLTWGPGYYHQKQFFEGKDNRLSTRSNLLRYDLEISGFPSSHAGHVVLLRLRDQEYPHAHVLEDWPTYTIPVLKWAKAQNAITGYAHSGLGLEVKTNALPNYDMPAFDGIGANEYIVAVTQNLVDFISTIDTPPTWELNIWYHTLNCGFRTRISGETDFPCMSDDRVAHGRSYVKCASLNFDEWAEGIRLGKAYVSQGKSHLMDFNVNGVDVGTQNSEVNLPTRGTIRVTAKVAACLAEQADTTAKPLDVSENIWHQRPFWKLERARVHGRKVPVELIVNGVSVDRSEIEADGTIRDVFFQTTITESSWVALRIMPSSHSNPIFVLVNHKPIRASRKSAEWCLQAVDVCWKQKKNLILGNEKDAAQRDYENAKKVYRQIADESH